MSRVWYRFSGCCKLQSGFTILELMVSIALLSLLVLIVAGSMRLGYRSVEKGERRTVALERLTVSCTIIDAQIQSAIPINVAVAGENPYILKGTKDSVRFVSNYSLIGGRKGYVVIAYRVNMDTNNKYTLYVCENVRGVENQKEMKLIEGFDNIHFEYYFGKKTDGQEEWTEEWNSDIFFPQKIRVYLAWGGKMITMIVPMRAIKVQM
jgi:general secretion pathway protein J